MKTRLSLCAVINCLVVGSGCAQAYVPGRCYRTTYTTAPVVYTTQPVVTYRVPSYQYSTTYRPVAQPVRQTAVQVPRRPFETCRSIERTISDVNAQVDAITRQVNRQIAEVESQIRRQIEDGEVRFRRQMEESERMFARQMANASRQASQVSWQPLQTATITPENSPSSFGRQDESDGPSRWDTIFATAKEWGTSATDYLRIAPWWVWGIGIALLFLVVFLLSARDAGSQPFQPRQTQPFQPRHRQPFRTHNDNPWVVDPANN